MTRLSNGSPEFTRRLRPNAIGVPGLIFMVMGCTAPLTGVASNLTLSLGFGMGRGAVGAILVVAGVLMLFSAGYIAISRRVVNSGAYYAYVGFGLGRRAGASAAMSAMLAYNAAAAVMAVLVGYFGKVFSSTYLGIDIPWWSLTAITIVAAWYIGVTGVSMTAKVAAWVAVSEFALLVGLAVAVLIQRPEGFTFDVFAPSEVFSGNVGLGLIFVFFLFGGYEAAAVYGEEARGARDTIGRATYLSLGILTAVFVLATWTLVAAVSDVAASAQADPGGLVTSVATTYLGEWAGPVILVMITFSFFAAALSFHAMAARYLYATGREGYFPRRLGAVHPTRGTPVVAGTLQAVVCVVLIVPFVIAGADPLVDFLPAVGGLNSLAVMFLMISCSASVIVAYKQGRLGASRWAGLIAPAITLVAFISLVVLIVRDYTAITGSDSLFVNLMPIALLIAIVYGFVMAGRTEGPAFAVDPESSEDLEVAGSRPTS